MSTPPHCGHPLKSGGGTCLHPQAKDGGYCARHRPKVEVATVDYTNSSTEQLMADIEDTLHDGANPTRANLAWETLKGRMRLTSEVEAPATEDVFGIQHGGTIDDAIMRQIAQIPMLLEVLSEAGKTIKRLQAITATTEPTREELES